MSKDDIIDDGKGQWSLTIAHSGEYNYRRLPEVLTQRRFHAIMYGMDLIGLEKTGKMLEDRIAMVTTVQVKRVADNVEMVTDSLRIIIQTAADIVTAWKPRLMPKGDG